VRFTCPVCAFPYMEAAPRNYEICPCCGTEFGNDDEFRTHDQIRAQWIQNGLPWFFRTPPINWNPWLQLLQGNHLNSIPFVVSSESAKYTSNVAVEVESVLDRQNETVLDRRDVSVAA
jgi:hypothetical protein